MVVGSIVIEAVVNFLMTGNPVLILTLAVRRKLYPTMTTAGGWVVIVIKAGVLETWMY